MKISSKKRRGDFSKRWVKLTQDELFSVFKSLHISRVNAETLIKQRVGNQNKNARNQIFFFFFQNRKWNLPLYSKNYQRDGYRCSPAPKVILFALLFMKRIEHKCFPSSLKLPTTYIWRHEGPIFIRCSAGDRGPDDILSNTQHPAFAINPSVDTCPYRCGQGSV